MFFCGEEFIVIDKRHSDRTKKLFKVDELPSIDTILSKCTRRGYTWSEDVGRRISLSIDLVASDASYHQQCKSNFLKKKDVPGQGQIGNTPGLPSNKAMVESFKTFRNWLDGQTELYTVVELYEKLRIFAENDGVYSIKWQKNERKLQRFHFLC